MDVSIVEIVGDAGDAGLAVKAGTASLFTIRPEPAPILTTGHAPATHLVYEWSEYVVAVPGASRITAGGIGLEPIVDGWFRLSFANQLGLAELRAYGDDGRALGEPLRLLVLSPKFAGLDEHVSFYGALLDDLFTRIVTLPFVVSAPTSQQVEEAMRPPGPIFALHFFTHEAERITSALRTIQAMPHRRLTTEPELLPVHAVTEIDPDALLDIARSPERWLQTAHARSPLAHRLRGHLPETIWQQLPRDTLDTPENRFVLGAARQFAQGLGSLRRQSWWKSVPEPQRRQLDLLGGALRRFNQDPKFAEVGAFGRPPSSSRVLLRKDGYRDLFALWGAYQRARRPLFAALDAAMAVRDVATLYEYWVYYRLIDELAEITGATPVVALTASSESGIGWHSTARFGPAGVLRYNPPMRGYSLIGLRPDMVWEPATGAPVAFDAKFRLRTAYDGTDQWNEADLVKMHAYRDALDVRAAVAIYPGDLSQFWMADRSRADHSTSIRDVILNPVEGIGAFARTPGREG